MDNQLPFSRRIIVEKEGIENATKHGFLLQ
jgi:hypothetical protein